MNEISFLSLISQAIPKFYTDNIFLGTAEPNANFVYVVRNHMHLYTNAQIASSFLNYIALSI